ncbi:type II secretion system protein J [Pseudomonas sp. Hp2]|uniref:type II secretion system protein J n=1 Tax=Pseudomonas sp. Hp2 TaxID=701189 RepID=UPI00112BF4E1|nr:type II secretion system protein J [Pseudomonas sp. Hp2]
MERRTLRRNGGARAAGFTLLEVLLATALLAGGLALAFATLRSAGAVGQRGEAIARQSERIRAVEGFLRQRLASALPVMMERERETGQAVLFVGEPQSMRFVADVPDYLGRGGPYRHALKVEGQAPAQRLQLELAMVQAGKVVEEAPVSPEQLADALEEVRFGYRGIDPENGKLGDWQDRWQWHDRLPVLVRIDVRSAQGRWPTLLVALPQAGNAGARP